MKPLTWASCLLMAAATFLFMRVGSESPQSAHQATATNSKLTPQQVALRRQEIAKYAKVFFREREKNHFARLNNGSSRSKMTLLDLPPKVREEAEQVVNQYKTEIYPAIKKYLKANQGYFPISVTGVPELSKFMEDNEYRGTGPRIMGRGSWLINPVFRMDGTMISRDVYSKLPPDAPHDAWAYFDKFLDVPSQAKGFRITGWDDGMVTIDPTTTLYQGGIKSATGREPGAASPGQAGIPLKKAITIKQFFSDEAKKVAKENAAKKEADHKEGANGSSS